MAGPAGAMSFHMRQKDGPWPPTRRDEAHRYNAKNNTARKSTRNQRGDRAKLFLERTDRVLSRLFTPQRWKLASALGDALQVLGRSRGQAPEDRLRELKGEIRALLQQ